MKLGTVLALTVVLTTPALAAGERQYVALPNSGRGVILWTDRAAATNCARATLRGTDQQRQELCEDGVGGVKPKVGLLDPGTAVERLDPEACGDLVRVRVLDGPVTGGIGCISGGSLTRTPPQ